MPKLDNVDNYGPELGGLDGIRKSLTEPGGIAPVVALGPCTSFPSLDWNFVPGSFGHDGPFGARGLRPLGLAFFP